MVWPVTSIIRPVNLSSLLRRVADRRSREKKWIIIIVVITRYSIHQGMYSTGRWSRKSKTRHLSAINEGKSHVRKKENRNPREVANDIDNGRTMPMERRPAASARRRQVQMQTCPWGARVVNAYNIRRQCEPTLQAGLRYLVISWYWGSSLRVCVSVSTSLAARWSEQQAAVSSSELPGRTAPFYVHIVSNIHNGWCDCPKFYSKSLQNKTILNGQYISDKIVRFRLKPWLCCADSFVYHSIFKAMCTQLCQTRCTVFKPRWWVGA